MGNSKITIIIVMSIVMNRLVAVHFYLKTKINQSESNNKSENKHKSDNSDE